jgi:GDP-mannose 6-dehydrogenase
VIPALEQASGKRFGADFSVCVNPEFLREGSAIEDFLEAPVTVMGAVDPGHLQSLWELYSWVAGQVFETSLATAEMIKYSCNAFHALKVAFANEMATFAKELGVDIEALTDIFTADRKLNISAAYLKPGFAFGGSCLPKDLRAVSYRAKELDLKLPLLAAILPSNEEHIARAIEAVLATGKRKIGLLGLSFKPGTDDLRESPSVQVIKTLLGEGCQVRVWDANVSLGMLVGSNRQFVNEVIPHIGSLLCPDIDDVLQFAEAVLIGSNSIDGQQIARSLSPGQILINLVKIETAGGLLATANARGGI